MRRRGVEGTGAAASAVGVADVQASLFGECRQAGHYVGVSAGDVARFAGVGVEIEQEWPLEGSAVLWQAEDRP